MAATETVTLRLVAEDLMSGNVTKAIGSLDKLAKQGGLVGSVAQGVGQSIGQMVNPLSLATKAFDMMTSGIGMAASGLAGLGRAYKEDQAEQEQLNNTLMRNISNWRDYTDEIDAAIAAGQRLAFSDTEQRMSLGRLVTATRDARRAITLNRLAMDIARQRNIKLAEASSAVTKAAQGQYKGLKALGYIVDTTADSTKILADVTLQAADSADTWAKTDQGRFAVRLMEISEAAEANGAALTALDGINKDLALTTLDVANTTVMYGGILMDFLGIGKNAEGQTIAQAQAMAIYGKRLQEIGWSYNRFVDVVSKDFGGLAPKVKHAFTAMFTTMDSQKEPWRDAWKELARIAKDPFRPAGFEKWLAKQADKAAAKAAEAALNHKPQAERYWKAFAWVMERPVLAALAHTQAEILALVEAAAKIQAIDARIGNFRRNGSTGRNPAAGQTNLPNGVEAGHNASGTSNWRGGWTWVGERGPELVNLPGGSQVLSAERSARAAQPITVNVTHIGARTEAEGRRLAQTVTPHIQRELARGGR